jgi:cold-inducible RNA-binding protein
VSAMFKVFVGNLSFKTTVDQLRGIFSPHIEVEDIVLATDPKTEKALGYGFILTKDADKCRIALRRIGKRYMDGRLVYFKEAHGKKKPIRARGAARRRGSRPARSPRTPSGGGYVGLSDEN